MGKIIAVYGANGSGKTTIACNLAYLLSRDNVTGIMSTDMQYGNLQHFYGMNIPKDKDLSSMLINGPKEEFMRYFNFHPDNQNLFVSSIADDVNCLKLADEASCDGAFAKSIYEELKDAFHYLIVDCATYVNNPLTIYALLLADRIIKITKPDIQGVAFDVAHNAIFDALELSENKILHLTNNDQNYVGVKSIERSFNVHFALHIPTCKGIEKAENKGIPICQSGTGSKEYHKSMQALYNLIGGGDII